MSFTLPPDDLALILEKTLNCFSLLKNQNILLTGGTGFFGKWFLECFGYARAKGLYHGKLFVLSRSPEAFLKKYPHFENHEIHWIKGDVSSFHLDNPVHSIIHMAADVSLGAPGECFLHFQKTIEAAERISSLAKRYSARVLLVSSGAAEAPAIWNPLSPSSFYTESKKLSELLFSDALKETPCHFTIGRCYSFLGPYLPIDSHYAAGNFIRDTLLKKKIVIKGTGKDLRSYMYPADLVIWLLHLLSFGNNQGMYAIGSDEKVSLADLASRVDQMGTNQGVDILGGQQAGLAPSSYFPDVEKIKHDLKLELYTSLNSSIEKTLAWHLRNKNA